MNYRIEEVAEKTGLTKRALRYYEELGLVQPAGRTEGGYRIYSDEDIQKILYVKDSRALLGVSLAEIKEYLTLEEQAVSLRSGCSSHFEKNEKLQILQALEQVVQKQKEILQRKIEKMNNVLITLDDKLQRIEERKRDFAKEE